MHPILEAHRASLLVCASDLPRHGVVFPLRRLCDRLLAGLLAGLRAQREVTRLAQRRARDTRRRVVLGLLRGDACEVRLRRRESHGRAVGVAGRHCLSDGARGAGSGHRRSATHQEGRAGVHQTRRTDRATENGRTGSDAEHGEGGDGHCWERTEDDAKEELCCRQRERSDKRVPGECPPLVVPSCPLVAPVCLLSLRGAPGSRVPRRARGGCVRVNPPAAATQTPPRSERGTGGRQAWTHVRPPHGWPGWLASSRGAASAAGGRASPCCRR